MESKELAPSGEVALDAAGQRMAGITVEAVQMQSLSETVQASGTFVYNEDETFTAGSLLEGRVVQVRAAVGDTVRKGQVLAEMHSHELHDARANYRKATTDLAGMRAAEAQAQRARDRARRLLDLKSASQQEVEGAEGELRRAQTAVADAQTELDRHRVHIVEFLEVPLEEDQHEKPGHTDDFIPIKAPGNGVVIERKVTAGTVLSQGDPAFRISNLNRLWLIASVNEADLRYVRIGQQVRVAVRAFPDRFFSGKVLRLGEELDSATRTLKVRVAVPNPGGLLKPEMYASVDLARQTSRDALFVPSSALQDWNGNQVVFVQKASGKFQPRTVQTTVAGQDQLRVLAGLAAGDKVVTKGAFILKSHMLKSSLQEE